MITLSNLRTEQDSEWTRLICDFAWTGDVPNPFKEKTIWFAMKNENADFFSTKVYDPFLLVPYFVAMHYHILLYWYFFLEMFLKNCIKI